MLSKPKLLVLLSRIPYPLDKGDKLRAFHQIKDLNASYQVILCCLSTHKIDPEAERKLKAICFELKIIQLGYAGILWRLFLALFNDKPFQVAYFYSKKAQQELDAIIEKHLPKRFFCQLIRVAEYAKKYSIFSKTLDYMDALSIGMERRAEKAPFYLKPIVSVEAKRLRNYEEKMFQYFEKKVIISLADKEHLTHSNSTEIAVIPNGIDTEFFKSENRSKKTDILFTGNMGYLPNVESAQYLVKNILPILNSDIAVQICGKSPSYKVRSLAASNVEVTGWVDDIRTAYDEAKIFVAPLMLGSGLQNKLLEAMAMGLPCVTTPLANNALGAIPEEEILIASNEDEFKTQIERLLSDTDLHRNIAEKGHAFVTKNYNWQACNKRLMEVIES
ncbi:MAG: sugar transferase (PEP-CTERM/EpsH1 system associated) [Salibacteraceae bacterium]|jgi:sugar transferase (PEP-CTERM/EpsH1 system associated)